MQFYTQVFESANPRYAEMAEVLRYSSGNRVEVRRVTDTDEDLIESSRLHGTYVQNGRKTRHHQQLIEQHSDGDAVVLMDADMFVVRSIDPELTDALGDNDIAITYRSRASRRVFNSGLFITRVSPLTRRLHQEWVEACNRFLIEPRLFHEFSGQYGGVNQSSLAYVLRKPEFAKLKIARLTTLEWNAVSEEHTRALTESRVVHILGALRREVYSGQFTTPLGKIWRAARANCADDCRQLR